MRKRLSPYILLAGLMTLAISIGSFAYTYSNGGSTLAIAEPSGDIATSNVTPTQPSWGNVLNDISDTVDLVPDAAGDTTNIGTQFPAAGEHWDKVDEITSDDDATYVEVTNNSFREDLYSVENHSTQTAGGTINYVRVYMNARVTANSTQTNAYVKIKTGGNEFDGTAENLSTSYDVYYYQWTINPDTASVWTWSEIDDLQIGVGLRRPDVGQGTRVTRLWLEVGFDAPALTGSTSAGNLFNVLQDSGYTGDTSIKVYLLNTENLTKAYQELNMQLYLESSVESTKSPDYKTLNIQNGMATFWIDGGATGNKTLSVTGGTYTLFSREVSEWAAGYAVSPELYVEITQR